MVLVLSVTPHTQTEVTGRGCQSEQGGVGVPPAGEEGGGGEQRGGGHPEDGGGGGQGGGGDQESPHPREHHLEDGKHVSSLTQWLGVRKGLMIGFKHIHKVLLSIVSNC